MPGVVEEAWGTHTKGVGSTAWSEVRREEMSLQEVLFSKADLSLITHPPSLFPIPTYVPSRRKLCWACSQSFYKPHPPRLTVPLMWFNPNGPTFISLKKKIPQKTFYLLDALKVTTNILFTGVGFP